VNRHIRREDTLRKTRNIACGLSLLVLINMFAQMDPAGISADLLLACRLAPLAIAAVLAFTALRKQAYWWDALVLPVLIFLCGIGIYDPLAMIGLVIAVVAHQSLFGDLRLWLPRTLLCVATIPAVVSVARFDNGAQFSWHSSSVLAPIPQVIMMGVLTRALYVALLRQQKAQAREAVLATASREMLTAADVDEVFTIGMTAARRLIALNPGMVMLIARPGPDGLRIFRTEGLATRWVGGLIPPSVAENPADYFRAIMPGLRHWAADVTNDRYVFVGHRKRLPGEVLDAFETLRHQIVLGETSRASHAELDHRANHDHLTKLPNRAKFFQSLAAAVDEGPAGAVALLNIDLDDFKKVNDTYGHAAGDELLIQVAERIAEADPGHGLGARFGGDEFALMITGLTDPATADKIAEDLCARLVAPMALSAATVRVGASIGVAVLEPQCSATELIRRADIAMYSAKALGKNRVVTFTAEVHGEVARHRQLEDQLPYAIARGEIAVYFQPYLDLATGTWAGIEALAAWHHPRLGLVSCRPLLAIAERTGDLADVTAHILRSVAGQLAAVPGGTVLPIGLNLGARQLLDPDFADAVLATLAETGLDPHRLILEIIESEHIDDPAARDQLHRLAAGGVRIALDDFGIGYVSLTSLRSFPIHQLKVDAGFLTGDPAALDLVLSVADLLGTQTVVQGVTTPEQVTRLRRTTASAVQGDLLCGIVPVAELAPLLVAGAPAYLGR
jgi:diguanylate cyclase (GGDEF)-like protein